MATKKVFCNECRFMEVDLYYMGDKGKKCTHPKNIDHNHDTYYEVSRVEIEKAKVLNKDNNCPWFRTKRIRIKC